MAASKLGTAIATWLSFPRFQTLVGGEAAADRDLTNVVDLIKHGHWHVSKYSFCQVLFSNKKKTTERSSIERPLLTLKLFLTNFEKAFVNFI